MAKTKPISENTEDSMNQNNFTSMGLSPGILRALEEKGFSIPTPVQKQTIPPMMEQRDIIAKAPTGTGKTFAFGIPIIEHIDAGDDNIQALIVAPTRELAIQICAEMKYLCSYIKGLRVVSVYGGQSVQVQVDMLRRKPHILVATPGRLLDHVGREHVCLNHVRTVVLDEADRMLDMGFYKDASRILDLTNGRKNLALLSATLSPEVMTIGWEHQRDPVEITVFEDQENKPDIIQYVIETSSKRKAGEIIRIMEEQSHHKAIVFCNTKFRVDRLTRELREKGFPAECIHGDIRQSIREKVMARFRKGGFRLLIATDVASRGLDVEQVDAVINYDIPEENQDYIHRIGRTGRAKKRGVAYTFLSDITDSVRIDEIKRHTNSIMQLR